VIDKHLDDLCGAGDIGVHSINNQAKSIANALMMSTRRLSTDDADHAVAGDPHRYLQLIGSERVRSPDR
jgi:hypothetical protein